MSRRRHVISFSSVARTAMGVVGVAAMTVALSGCGKAPASEITNRLWVSSVPKNPRQSTTAFAIASARGRNIGVLHQGSVYEARHRAFGWAPVARTDKAQMTLLQDNSVHEVRIETCKPTRGFDRCIMLHGDPTGAVRYQSRKRWTLRRSKSVGATAPDFVQIVHELEARDPELAGLIAAEPAK